ncbi:MAG: SdrD B-like domain-containing protein, partial [Vicinamibacterales bacterium]
DPNNYSAIGAGDILRACASGPGSWTLENNGTCGSITTGGANNTQGPGNGEYYYQEDHPFHDEVAVGGLFQIAGYTDTVATAFDPVPSPSELYDGGALWMNSSNGARLKTYRVFNGGVILPNLFGKANGLSDIEALCRPAPIEIGNRVWRDRTDVTRDGIQGPTQIISPTDREEPIPGVTVRLFLGGALIATTTSNAAGEYYFNASNVPGGILPFMTYTLRVDNPADYAPLAPLDGLTLTLSNQGAVDTRDSDGVIVNNYPEITAVTRGYGDSDHTFDFGFHNIPTAVELLYFRVDKVSGKQVHLAWATAMEIDNFGFNLYRAPVNDFSRARLIHFEPSSIGGSGPGATYAYVDTVPANGVWWYWLADLDTQGHETRHAPVSAGVGLDALLPHRIYLPLITKGPP